ncbi:MAG: hypothetical protein AAGK04_07810 [Planctomycetota bacterium]
MTGKLAAVIAVSGATACALLGARQARIQAAHELAESRFRQLAIEEDHQRLRAILVEHARPDAIDADGLLHPSRPLDWNANTVDDAPPGAGEAEGTARDEPTSVGDAAGDEEAEGRDAALGGGVAPAAGATPMDREAPR